jgi:hypothetical protein
MGTISWGTRVRVGKPVMLAVLGGLLTGTGAGASLARYAAASTVGSNAVTTAARFDVTPPAIAGSVIAKAPGTGQYLVGQIKATGSFYVYANVTDTGAGASGVATVTANVSTIKTGATAVALVAGSYGVGGVSYTYRSAPQTATATVAQSYSYSITAIDNAANTATNGSFTVSVNTSQPVAADIQTTNGGTAGRPDTGDRIVFTYTEQVDPESILAGWTGASTAITVRFTNNKKNDSVAVWNGANSGQLPLGSVVLNGNFVSADTVFAATMVQSGSTITVGFGAMSSGAPLTDLSAGNLDWTPSGTATDAAGNACSTTSMTETGASDIDF